MKKWYLQLSRTYKTAVLSLFVTFVCYLGVIFGYFIDLMGLPNGIALGGLIGSLSYLFMGLAEQKDEKSEKLVRTIIVTIIRFVLIGLFIALSIFLEYSLNIKVFNVFAVVGGYFIALLVYIILTLKEKQDV